MDNVEKLKVMVQQVYGIPLRYGNQCKGLSHSISKHSNEYISYQTLRRFFGFINSNSVISIYTLNVLAMYCGYKHYEDFIHQQKKKKNVIADYIEIIYSIPLRKELDDNFHFVCRNLAKSFYYNLKTLIPYASFIAKSSVGQVFFYERFPFFDFINNDFYRKALNEYNKNKNTESATIFYEALCLFGDFLNGKKKLVQPTVTSKKNSDLHPFLQMRLVCNELLLEKKSRIINIKNINAAFNIIEKNKNELTYITYSKFIICEYLMAIEEYNEACNLLNRIEDYFLDELPVGWKDEGFYEVFYLMSCICTYKEGDIALALANFKKINLQLFNFTYSKYYTIWYLILKKKLVGLSKDEIAQKNDLIEITKFYKMKEIEKNF